MLANESCRETRELSDSLAGGQLRGEHVAKTWSPGRAAFPSAPMTLTVPASSPSMNVVVIQALGASS
jgi:hypothetical protein